MSTTLRKFTFFILLITVVVACGNEETPAPNTSTQQQTEEEQKERRFLRTTTPYLRIRATPDIEGAILKILGKEALLEYMHDSTTFKTKITHRRKKYLAPWYKVKTRTEEEGWIFGGLVEFLPYLENKQLAQKIQAEETLAAANSSGANSTPSTKKQQDVNQSALDRYSNSISQLSINKATSVTRAMNLFKAQLVGKVNKTTCDAAFIAFDDFHSRVLGHLQNSINTSKYQYLKKEIIRYGMATMRSDSFIYHLGQNGFNFGIKNGKVILVKDIDYVFRLFYRECSTPMRAYMNQYEEDETTYWLDKEKLHITPLKLTRWVLTWNYFVAKNPNFTLIKDAKSRLSKQLTILLKGTQKTPVFDSASALNNDFKEAYLHITTNYPKSNIGQQFQQYINVLERNNWQDNAIVRQAQNDTLNNLLEA